MSNSQKTLQEAVNEYITNKEKISPYDLVNDLLSQYYPVSDIVLSAAKYFTTIIKRKDMCVDQNKLGEYNIITLRDSNGKSHTNNILKMLNQYNRIDGKDYNRLNVEAIRKTGKIITTEYKLTPKTFFLCLTRSKNSCEYAEYYFHVLEIFDYYEEYFTSLYKQRNMELKEENISLSSKIDMLLKKMDIQNDKMDKQSEQLSELQITVNKISSKLDSCAHMPDNNELSDRFVVMKSKIDYYVIRAQDRNICNAIKRQESKGYKKIKDLIESESIPNSIYLWNTALIKN